MTILCAVVLGVLAPRPAPQLIELSSPTTSHCTPEHRKLCEAGVAMLTKEGTQNITLPDGRSSAFIRTGDLNFMWLRDSAEQVAVDLSLVDAGKTLAPHRLSRIVGALRTAAFFVTQDPYANAFNPRMDASGKWAMERKFELDSLISFLRFTLDVWSNKRLVALDPVLFARNGSIHAAVQTVLRTLRTETNHQADSTYTHSAMSNGGRGPPHAPMGLIWSGFRPSDDPREHAFSIPSNVFAAVQLERLTEHAPPQWRDSSLIGEARALSSSIGRGLRSSHVMRRVTPSASPGATSPTEGHRYCYEADGFGGCLEMDDANMPSLLSLPLLDPENRFTDRETVHATRAHVLSRANPNYFCGTAGCGIGSPHVTGPCSQRFGGFGYPCQSQGFIWPMSLVIQYATSSDESERATLLNLLLQHAGASGGTLHESFDANDVSKISRPEFGWVNALFVRHACAACLATEAEGAGSPPQRALDT